MKYHVTLAGRTYEVDVGGDRVALDGRPVPAELHAVPGTPLRQLVGSAHTRTFAMTRLPGGWRVIHAGDVWDIDVVDERTRQLRAMTGAAGAGGGPRVIAAPMPGLVLRVEVEVGHQVAAGQGLIVLEAMKMENELTAPGGGEVTAIHVVAGQAVDKGTPLVEVRQEG